MIRLYRETVISGAQELVPGERNCGRMGGALVVWMYDGRSWMNASTMSHGGRKGSGN